MQKIYKLILSIVALAILSLGAFAQSEVEYRDVVLDGKPAILNVATGEITLVNPKDIEKAKQSKTIEQHPDEDASIENTSDYYVVKEGETLFEIANRYNTSLMALRKANNLETTLVEAGQTLRVKNLDTLTNTAKQETTNTNYENNNSNFHRVVSGETLYNLAKRYNLTLNELKRLNDLNDLNANLIKVGQKLRVRGFIATNELDLVSVWTVSKGDTLYSIAKEKGITVDTIKSLNGLTGNLIRVGQKLQLK
jgi:LysM repeat protein